MPVSGLIAYNASPCIKSSRHNLSIISNGITNLSALTGLGMVDGDLTLRDNRQLTDLTGLEDLREVGGDLVIFGASEIGAGLASLRGRRRGGCGCCRC